MSEYSDKMLTGQRGIPIGEKSCHGAEIFTGDMLLGLEYAFTNRRDTGSNILIANDLGVVVEYGGGFMHMTDDGFQPILGMDECNEFFPNVYEIIVNPPEGSTT